MGLIPEAFVGCPICQHHLVTILDTSLGIVYMHLTPGKFVGINPFAAGPIYSVLFWIWADRGHFRDHFGERIFQKE